MARENVMRGPTWPDDDPQLIPTKYQKLMMAGLLTFARPREWCVASNVQRMLQCKQFRSMFLITAIPKQIKVGTVLV